MMALRGSVGKSIVLDSLVKTQRDIYAIVYDEHPIRTIDSLFICSKKYCIEELCESVLRDVNSDGSDGTHIGTLVIYTNLSESEVSDIKDFVVQLEADRLIRYGIIMCKE